MSKFNKVVNKISSDFSYLHKFILEPCCQGVMFSLLIRTALTVSYIFHSLFITSCSTFQLIKAFIKKRNFLDKGFD